MSAHPDAPAHAPAATQSTRRNDDYRLLVRRRSDFCVQTWRYRSEIVSTVRGHFLRPRQTASRRARNQALLRTWRNMDYEIQEHCPDCGVSIGRLHRPSCDVERCPDCAHQRFSCDCTRKHPKHRRFKWDGYWPCKEFVDAAVREGFYVRWGRNGGWLKCTAEDEGARVDTSRLLEECTWDPAARQWHKDTENV